MTKAYQGVRNISYKQKQERYRLLFNFLQARRNFSDMMSAKPEEFIAARQDVVESAQGYRDSLDPSQMPGEPLHQEYAVLTPAEFDAHRGAFDKILAAPAEAHSPDKFGKRPLDLALGMGNTDVINVLVRNGADLDAPDVWGQIPRDRITSLAIQGLADLLHRLD